jgi:hypothetical protein
MYPGYHIKICGRCKFVYSQHEQLSVCPHPYKQRVDDQHDQGIKELFHKLWSRHVGTEGYIKADWMELQQLLQARGIDI